MHIDQFEFRGVPTDFRLLTETTQDGERIQREREQKEKDQAEAAKLQTDLFPIDRK